jgi:Helitron helicase-like domain at N-terminus
LKSINASTSKMWGSNEEREAMARKVDAMTIRYGAPSVFWTLTPNPDCSITCAFWSGQLLPGGRPDSLTKCAERNMPCSSEMARMVMQNTVVQAQYYKVCCHLLIDILFGWDMCAQKPKAQRGIFGVIEALVYALEQQGRLLIHRLGSHVRERVAT